MRNFLVKRIFTYKHVAPRRYFVWHNGKERDARAGSELLRGKNAPLSQFMKYINIF
jgi:hypothetical protein